MPVFLRLDIRLVIDGCMVHFPIKWKHQHITISLKFHIYQSCTTLQEKHCLISYLDSVMEQKLDQV